MKSYVYIIQEHTHGNGAVKIGKANNIEKRILTLQVGNPRRLYLVRYLGPYSESDSFSVEAAIHDAVSMYSISGEWFGHQAVQIIKDAEAGRIRINGVDKEHILHPSKKRERNTNPIDASFTYKMTGKQYEPDIINEIKKQLKDAWVSVKVNGTSLALHINNKIYGLIMTDALLLVIDNKATKQCTSIESIPECVAWAMDKQEQYMKTRVMAQ